MLKRLRMKLGNALRRRLDVPDIPRSLERLKLQGFQPGTIFDVGAYNGDFARLYHGLWPNAQIHCFEPLPHKQAALRLFAEQMPQISIYDCLLGATEQEAVPFYSAETASSALPEHHSEHPQILCRQRTVDGIGSQPDLLELDVQGYELEVLKGAAGSLPGVSVLLLETNLIDIHRGAPLLADIVGWLREKGFVAFDLCGLTRRPLDRALWQVDLIFVPIESPLRASKHWQ